MTGSIARDQRRPAHVGWLSDLVPGDFALPAFLVVAVALGGGGSPSPLPEMLLEWAALATLAAVVLMRPRGEAWPRPALAFAVGLVLLPVIQLIPLPPAVWQSLPGREIEKAAIGLAGAGSKWMPLSVSPSRTLAGFLALLVPSVAVLVAAVASPRGRSYAIAATAVMALVSAAVGAGQLAGGAHSVLRFYAASHVEVLTGFQANRNSEADILIVGLFALAAGATIQHIWKWRGAAIVFGAAGVLLAGAVLLTASRAGIALLVLALAGAAAATAWRYRTRVKLRAGLAVGATALALLAVLAWTVAANPVIGRIAGRFTGGSEPRPEIWQDTLYAIGQYWPIGSGIGTFVPVFVAAERLEAVDSSFPNRAHNDFLELVLEAGTPGLIVLALLVGMLVWRFAIRWRAAHGLQDRAELAFALATLVLLGAHSIVDYPLRSMALATLAGVASGYILAPARHRGGAVSPGRVETKQL
jgi:O-antigen ligase